MNDPKIIKLLEKALNDAIQKAGKEVGDELNMRLSALPSEYYERTGQIVLALRHPKKVTITNSGKVDYSIFNQDYVHSFRSGEGFNHHMSFDGSSTWKGQSIPSLVPIWLNNGFTLPDHTIWHGLNYVQSVLGNQTLSEYVIKEIEANSLQEIVALVVAQMMGGGV